MELLELLRTLSEAFGPPGFEDQVRDMLRENLSGLCDRIEEDPLGNLTAWRDGQGDRVLMLDAHTDEVGILVSHVDDRGFVRFVPLGGWDARLFPGARVTLRGKDGFVSAAVAFPAPHITKPEDRNKAIAAEELFLDLGCHSKADAFDLGIGPGTPGVLDGPFRALNDHLVLGKAFDDRAGCAAALIILETLKGKPLPFQLAVNFATSEELGLRGAKVASYRIQPDVALVLETTTGADFPGIPEHHCPTKLGSGVAITVADRTMLTTPKMLRFLLETAEEKGIAHQLKQPMTGGTDGGEIHLSRSGVLTGVLATPCRYLHGPSSVLDLRDLKSLVDLTLAALEKMPENLLK